jgi:DNA-binding MarR family transcriptional regulator
MELDAVDKLLAQWRHERPELDVSGLAIVVRIEWAAKLLRQDTAESLGAAGLKLWEYDVLSALRRQGPPYALLATELADASLLTTGATTTRIDNLEQRGWVRRKREADDRRAVRVELTRTGLALVDRAIRTRLAAADASTRVLSPRQRAELETGLRTLLLALTAGSSDPLDEPTSPDDPVAETAAPRRAQS